MQIQDESHIQWKLFLEGKDEAYSWLYSTYIQLLYQYGLQITLNTDIIKDCIQDVFVKIYRNRKKLATPQSVKTYLMISLRNSIYNVFSQERVQEAYVFNFHQTEDACTVENSFFDEEERREQIKEIKEMLAILTPRQREIIYYRFIEELDYDEICQLMQLNYQSAYNLLQRSLSKIRSAFGTTDCILLLLSLFPKAIG